MIKLESREDGRYLACSCLLRCVVTQRPGSTVNCYHQCCFRWAFCQVLEPPDNTGIRDISSIFSLSSLALSTSVLEGPSSLQLGPALHSQLCCRFKKDENNFSDHCGHSKAARKKQASMEQSPHTAEIRGKPMVSPLSSGVGCFSQPWQ